MAGGNSHQRAMDKAARARMAEQVTETIVARLNQAEMVPAVHHHKRLPARLFDFIEQPLVLTALFALGGVVGALIYTPFFILCAVCILLGFHRAKVVSAESARVQIPVYAGLMILLSVSGYFLYGALNSALDRVQTASAKKIATLLGEPPPSPRSASAPRLPIIRGGPFAPTDLAKYHLNSDPDELTLYDLYLLDFPGEAQYQSGVTVPRPNTYLEWTVVWNIADGSELIKLYIPHSTETAGIIQGFIPNYKEVLRQANLFEVQNRDQVSSRTLTFSNRIYA